MAHQQSTGRMNDVDHGKPVRPRADAPKAEEVKDAISLLRDPRQSYQHLTAYNQVAAWLSDKLERGEFR